MATNSLQKTSSATRVPTIDLEESSLNGQQIKFLHPWTGETARIMDQLVSEFNQSNQWGVRVIPTAAGSAGMLSETLADQTTNEKVWDVVAAPVSKLLVEDQKNENVLDLNPYVQSSKFGLTDSEREDFHPAFWAENIVGGKLYGIPAQQSAAVLFYNMSWAQELGYSAPPLTTADFKSQVCKANSNMKLDNDRTNDSLGGWIIDTDAITLLSWIQVFEGFEPYEVIGSLNNEGIAQTFAYLINLAKASCAWPSRLPAPYDYFVNRQALAYSGSMQDILPQQAAFERVDSPDEWKVISYPADSQPTWLAEGSSYAVLETTPKRQLAAWLFVRWLSAPEHQARLLMTTGTLPLGEDVMTHMTDFGAAHPQWAAMAGNLETVQPLTPSVNLPIQLIVIEDAGRQLFNTEFKPDQVDALTLEMDTLFEELIERQP